MTSNKARKQDPKMALMTFGMNQIPRINREDISVKELLLLARTEDSLAQTHAG